MFNVKPMEKRKCERIPSGIKVKLFYDNSVYFGTIENLSEGGMFISAKRVYCHTGSEFDIFIPFKGELLFVTARVIRMTKTDDIITGLGVQLLDLSHKYLELIGRLKNRAGLEARITGNE